MGAHRLFAILFLQDDEEYDVHCGEHCSVGTPWFIKWLIRYGIETIKRWKARPNIDHFPHSLV